MPAELPPGDKKLKNWCWISAGTLPPRHWWTSREWDIELVTSYKYLGVHLNYKLDWTDHASALFKKGQTVYAQETDVFWTAGGAPEDFLRLTGRDWIDWSGGTAWSWDTRLSQWRWWDRGGWWRSCLLWWETSPTLCRTPSQHWVAPSAIDWLTLSVSS